MIMGYDLFNPPPNHQSCSNEQATKNCLSEIEHIEGLSYIPGYLSKVEHDALVNQIQKQTWLQDIRRRVQHYGWRYDYKARSIDYSMFLGKLPDWLQSLAERLYADKHLVSVPDQVIVNEYLPGQGIAPHIDCQPCFENTIISISLLTPIVMDFVKVSTREKEQLLLEPQSMVAISDDARYLWTHGIAARKSDVFKEQRFERKLRISLTFRKVKLDNNLFLA
jgi:alkylated DNA repair dioxygenase AlkB